MSKQSQLDDIKASIVVDKVCPELAKTATNLVFGDGNPDADIVFIGEAPGKNEDLQGLPFVGAAGKFLDEMLAGINLKRAQVYITNIVKYRPPDNRDPLPEEKAAFLPYLERQIETINPLAIVTLGRHSMTCFLPDLQISQVHGQPKRIKVKFGVDSSGTQQNTTYLDEVQGSAEQRNEAYKKVRRMSSAGDDAVIRQKDLPQDELVSTSGKTATFVILPLYHPAAALYNGAMRQTLVDDFNRIPEILNLIRQAK
jgi:uracil-DNA glycosylase family 4